MSKALLNGKLLSLLCRVVRNPENRYRDCYFNLLFHQFRIGCLSRSLYDGVIAFHVSLYFYGVNHCMSSTIGMALRGFPVEILSDRECPGGPNGKPAK